uniref:Uncharacterized protein n=1 Tax=Photinus pyralis TaxID=7054 RepID=A0A1Y1KM70_PHOPY
MEEFDFASLNSSTYCKPFINAKDLEIGNKYPITDIGVIGTKFGDRIMVETETFKCILPQRYHTYLTEENRLEFLKLTVTNKVVFISSIGAVGSTTNLQIIT